MNLKVFLLVVLLCMFMRSSSVSAAHLIANWTFDDGSNPGKDSTGNGHDGIIIGSGATSVLEGRFGPALKLDGTTYIAIPSPYGVDTALRGGDRGFTISLWMKEPATGLPFSNQVVGQGAGYAYSIDWGQRWYIGKDGWETIQVVPPEDAEWHHWCLTWDAAALEAVAYLDGAVAGAITTDVGWIGNNTVRPATIGCDNRGLAAKYIGFVDDIAFWDGPLTAQQIASVYSNGAKSVGETNPVIEMIYPPFAHPIQGGEINITGLYLDEVTQVDFGGAIVYSSAFKSRSRNRIILDAPPHSEGIVKITVANPLQTFVFTEGFEYRSAKTCYVAIAGSNSNAGTREQPFRTIQKAVDSMDMGDTCYVREGTYHETVTAVPAGHISIKTFPGETVTLDGTEAISDLQTSDWTQYSGSIYKTTLNRDVWQLFVDGEMMIAARWPNASFDDDSIWDQDANWGHGHIDSEFGKMVTRTEDGRPDLAATGKSFQCAMAIMNIGKCHSHSRFVNSHSAGSNSFTYDADNAMVADLPILWDDGYFERTQRCYLECHLSCLDMAKEWYYNPATKELYLWTPDGQPPAGDIRGKTMTYAFDFSGGDNITISGFNFFGSTFRFLDSIHCTVENCDLEYFACTKRMLGEVQEGHYHDDAYYTMMHGPITGSWNTIRNCTFAYCDLGAFGMEGRYDLAENILIHHIDWSGIGSHSVHLYTAESTIRRLTATRCGASECIHSGRANLIELCDMGEKLGTLQQDGAAIQARPVEHYGTVVRNCWVHDSTKFGIRSDIYAGGYHKDKEGSNFLVHNNVVWGIRIRETYKPGIMIEGDYHKVYNNLSFDNEVRDICFPIHDGLANQETIARNNATGPDGIGIGRLPNGDDPPGTADHNWEGDMAEQIMDYQNRDFRPRPGSVLIDAGVHIPGVTDGYLGEAPDIGPYEYGDDSYWIPGYQGRKAKAHIPEHKSQITGSKMDFIWLGGYQGISYDVYIGTDRLSVRNADHDSPEFKGNQVNNVHTATGFDANITYYWRIDTVKASQTVAGDIWQLGG